MMKKLSARGMMYGLCVLATLWGGMFSIGSCLVREGGFTRDYMTRDYMAKDLVWEWLFKHSLLGLGRDGEDAEPAILGGEMTVARNSTAVGVVEEGRRVD